MLEKQVKQLDANARLLLQQAVMNPSLQQLFIFEKIEMQKQLLASFQTSEESDARYLRKLEILRNRILFVDEILAFFKNEKVLFEK